MAKYVLIKDGKVDNIIVADADFIEIIKDDYDKIIDYDEHPDNFGRDDLVIEHEDGSLSFAVNPKSRTSNPVIIDVQEVNKTAEIEAPATPPAE